MFPNVPLAIGRKRVFDSVFPPAPLSSISPTPESTPILGSTSPGQSWGGGIAEKTTPRNHKQQPVQQTSEADSPPEQITWDRAWHTATTYLSIPDKGFNIDLEDDGVDDDDDLDEGTLIKRWAKEPPSQFVSDNIFYVAADASPGRERRIGLRECDMQEWYMDETRRHFLCNFRDSLVRILKVKPSGGVLQRLVRYLRLAQNIYFLPFVKHISPLLDPTVQDTAFTKLRRNVHAIISYSLPESRISSLLAEELMVECSVVLGIIQHHDEDEEESHLPDEDDMDVDQKHTASYSDWRKEPSSERRMKMMTEGEDTQITDARGRLLDVLEGVQSVGLGGSEAQRVFANVMNKMVTEFVTSTYASEWASPSLAAEHLRRWIEDIFSRLVVQVLHVLKSTDGEGSQPEELDVTLSDVEKWQEIGMARLGALRIGELFDVVVDWDSSKGAVEDLKQYILNPATRYLLTTSFLASVGSRLLHPGASTVEILQIYISIIRAFADLDPRGVLLDRVAKPIRRYLKDRDDTIKVIVGGLLSEDGEGDDQDATADIERLPELAQELSDAHKLALRDDAADLDWDDMNWVPDPVDAAPDYKKSKTDVVGSLISLFDSKEVFVKELQKTLSDRLLKKNKDYEQEISVLELLKIRFGDSSLQACEVMLRDIIDSKRVDSFIRAEQQNLGAKEGDGDEEMKSCEDAPELHAKILSRLYWPSIQDMEFKIPDEVDSIQSKYSSGFESLKPARKLTWLNGLGRVTVELDLEDRVFKDEVTTWQATVIYAFQSPTPPASSSSSTQSVTKSVLELAEQLDMSASFVRSACLFWLSKQVLVEVEQDTFRVLETLPGDSEKESENVTGHKAVASPGRQGPGGGGGGAGAGHQNAAAAAAAAQEAAAKESADAAAMAQLDLYWQFIVGMLTNQGAMPLQRIIMMLKMVVPGGFPFSSEELKEFLGQKVSQGKLEMAGGGNYKIVK